MALSEPKRVSEPWPRKNDGRAAWGAGSPLKCRMGRLLLPTRRKIFASFKTASKVPQRPRRSSEISI